MLSFDSIPQARVVRKGAHVFAPPPAPRTNETTPLGEGLRSVLAVAFGMWPLTAVLLLAAGFLIMAANGGTP